MLQKLKKLNLSMVQIVKDRFSLFHIISASLILTPHKFL